MFDISWSELLILAVVTLIFVGPKDLPRFLAYVGRWAGVAKRHASEFRQVFDQAMREAELDQMRREVEEMQAKIERTVMEADKKTAEAQAAGDAPSTNSIAPPPAPEPAPQDDRPGPEVVSIEPPAAPQPDPVPAAAEQQKGGV